MNQIWRGSLVRRKPFDGPPVTPEEMAKRRARNAVNITNSLLKRATPAAAKKLISLLDCADQRIAFSAAKAILDYGRGKATESVEVTVSTGAAALIAKQIEDRPPPEWAQRAARGDVIGFSDCIDVEAVPCDVSAD